MIKINKDITEIPDSLQLPFSDNFPPNRIPRTSKTTHSRRMEIIDNCDYIDEQKFNDRYKQDDTKRKLKDIYKNKCAYCEQKVEQLHVEHYRPKKSYHWFAYSWDNLLLACPYCNEYKGTNFELLGTFKSFENLDENIQSIHKCTAEYDLVEKPKMVNPETKDPTGKIEFQKNGFINSSDACFAYTIEKCKINRKYLNDRRRKLIDDVRKDFVSEFVDSETSGELQILIKGIIKKFIRDSIDLDNEFIGFRRFAISSMWLNEIIKELNKVISFFS